MSLFAFMRNLPHSLYIDVMPNLLVHPFGKSPKTSLSRSIVTIDGNFMANATAASCVSTTEFSFG